MSRFKRYTDTLASGYVLLGVNVFYTLASVPLALHYLTTEQFGLWALISLFSGYLTLIDAGMAGAVSRFLIDHRHDTTGNDYGSTAKTGFLVNLVQAVLIALLSPALIWFGRTMPGVPPELGGQFGWLLAGQCGVVILNFLGRTFYNFLWANHRLDVSNYALSATLLVGLVGQWYCLARGVGVYSIMWGNGLAAVASLALSAGMCWKLRLFPEKGRWGHASWTRFRELFAFAKDFFLYSLGTQLINASQAIVVTMCLGLKAAAVWSVCTRAYNLMMQLVWRILDASNTSLSEMLALGETAKFNETFRRVTVLTAAGGVVGAMLFAACNQPFVNLWTHGEMGWSVWNDVLLGVWLIFSVVQRCHCGVMGIRKDLRVVKYLYFVEGLIFLELGFALGGRGGYPAIIACSILATWVFTFRYGLHRSRLDFGLTRAQLWEWWLPAVKIGAVLLPLALALHWVASRLPTVVGLALMGIGIGAVGGWLLARWALDAELRFKLANKLPFRAGWLLGT